MNNKIAVLIWLYDVNKWPLFKQYLLRLKPYVSLYIGLCKDTITDTIQKEIIELCYETDGGMQIFDNVGADINSFLHQICNLDDNKHPLFIKLHTKNSIFSYRYRLPWLEMFIHSLICDELSFHSNIKFMNENPNCGMMSHGKFIINNNEHTNGKKIRELCEHLNIDYPHIFPRKFVGGTMFLSRTKLFKKYFNHDNNPFLYNKLSIEQKHIDDQISGKYSQSLERIFGYIMSEQNVYIRPTINRSKYKIYGNYLENTAVLHLDVLPNQFCYIPEISTLTGKILDDTHEFITIDWKDHISHTKQIFKKIDTNKLVFDQLA